MVKGRSSSSTSGSRPQLPFLVQHSDSAIGSSLGGSFSFLPPPPPYRPPRASSGSDGALEGRGGGLGDEGATTTAAQHQQQQWELPRDQVDFTSLLGFDRINNNGTSACQCQQMPRTVALAVRSAGSSEEEVEQEPEIAMAPGGRGTATTTALARQKAAMASSSFAKMPREDNGLMRMDNAAVGTCQWAMETASAAPKAPAPPEVEASSATAPSRKKRGGTAKAATTTSRHKQQQQLRRPLHGDAASSYLEGGGISSLSPSPTRAAAAAATALAPPPAPLPTTTTATAAATVMMPSASPPYSSPSALDAPPPGANSAAADMQANVQRLQLSRDSLSLQVAVLGQQVALQREKILDLETLLESRRRNSREGVGGTAMAKELAELRHKYAALERDKLEAERHLRLNSELERLASLQQQQPQQQQPQQQQIKRNALQQNGIGTRRDELEQLQFAVQRLMADNEQKDSMIQSLRLELDEQHRRLASAEQQQQQQLPSAPPAMMDINEQIRRILMEEPVPAQQQQGLLLNGTGSSVSHSSSYPLSLCHGHVVVGHPMAPVPMPSTSSSSPSSASAAGAAAPSALPPQCPARSFAFMPFSTSYSSALCQHQAAAFLPQQQQQQHYWRVASPPTIPPHHHTHHPHLGGPSPKTPASPLARQLAAELDELRRSGNVLSASMNNSGATGMPTQQQQQQGRRPPQKQQQQQQQPQPMPAQQPPPYSSASLPRSIHSKANSISGPLMSSSSKQLLPPPPGISPHHFESDDETASRVSCSTPGVAGGQQPGQQQQSASSSANAKQFKRGRRGRSTLRTFLSKFAHRGNSLQDLRSPRTSPGLSTPQQQQQQHPQQQQQTAATAFFNGSSGQQQQQICRRPAIRQFVDWDQARCAQWLEELGFEGCNASVLRSGRQLLNMGDGELERELGIRSGLQRKRLRCVLDRMERAGAGAGGGEGAGGSGTEQMEAADWMDTNQVMCWLDLVGLPQFRDIFAEQHMDGHLLLALTAQDLLELGIHSALNHASLARGIQFLRSVGFHLHRLERHFQSDPPAHFPCPADVERWSHGCTLEWLCSVDLAEFTPNLVFSGLHGALMVLEPTFTADTLADMLQIPAQKTLLRRHLTSQFNGLLGQQVIAHKREMLAQPFVTQLSPALRIRLAKKGFSLTRKKSKSDVFVEPEWPVCPPTAIGTTGSAVAQINAGEEMSDV